MKFTKYDKAKDKSNVQTVITQSGGGSSDIDVTIWGNHFDGSNNITGDLITQNNITSEKLIKGQNLEATEQIKGKNLEVTEKIVGKGTLEVEGESTFKDNASFKKGAQFDGETFVYNTLESKDHLPTQNNAWTLGRSDRKWRSLFSTGANFENLNVTNTATIKNLEVTGAAEFFELYIDKIKSVGGSVLFTPADSFKIDIITVDALTGDYYLYWKCGNWDKFRMSKWCVGDQALCRSFNTSKLGVEGIRQKYYWALVTAVKGVPEEIDGELYNRITISSTDYDGILNPQIGDEIVMCGNRGINKARQSAIYISAYDGLDTDLTAPFYATYQGINDFDLKSHRKTYIDVNGAEFIGNFKVSDDVTVEDYIKDITSKSEPYVGENGNWWINGKDTGNKAVGDDGLSPYIGKNGNWWIGTTDLNVKAVGVDGNTPMIGANGNWFINGVDTGLTSKGDNGRSPYINISTGTWWEYDAEKGMYVDTHIKAHGIDAYSPYVGDNGNWWIFDEDIDAYRDSGFSAIGDDGHSPYIGSDGYWYEWDPDKGEYRSTYIKAAGTDGKDGIDGKTFYWHTAWCINKDTGEGFTVTNTNGSAYPYLGTLVDNTKEDSTDFTKYTWTYIKGEDGDIGSAIKGEDGKTYYTHIAWCNDIGTGAGFSTGRQNGATYNYIGTLVDENERDSQNWRDYSWVYIRGDKGEDGKTPTIEIKNNEWWINGQNTHITAQGKDGKDGNDGIDAKTYFWHTAWCDNNVTGLNFTTSNTNGTGYKYLGTLVDNKVEDSKNFRDYTWTYIKGADGDAGDAIRGQDGKTYYTHIAWCNNISNGDGFSTSKQNGATYKYIGTLVDEINADSTNWRDYSWVYIKGDDGTDGKDAHSPYIGSDGYWYYWSDSLQKYVKGDKAGGTNGQNAIYYAMYPVIEQAVVDKYDNLNVRLQYVIYKAEGGTRTAINANYNNIYIRIYKGQNTQEYRCSEGVNPSYNNASFESDYVDGENNYTQLRVQLYDKVNGVVLDQRVVSINFQPSVLFEVDQDLKTITGRVQDSERGLDAIYNKASEAKQTADGFQNKVTLLINNQKNPRNLYKYSDGFVCWNRYDTYVNVTKFHKVAFSDDAWYCEDDINDVDILTSWKKLTKGTYSLSVDGYFDYNIYKADSSYDSRSQTYMNNNAETLGRYVYSSDYSQVNSVKSDSNCLDQVTFQITTEGWYSIEIYHTSKAKLEHLCLVQTKDEYGNTPSNYIAQGYFISGSAISSSIRQAADSIDLSLRNDIETCGIHLKDGTINLNGSVDVTSGNAVTIKDANGNVRASISPNTIGGISNLPTGYKGFKDFQLSAINQGTITNEVREYTICNLLSGNSLSISNIAVGIKLEGSDSNRLWNPASGNNSITIQLLRGDTEIQKWDYNTASLSFGLSLNTTYFTTVGTYKIRVTFNSCTATNLRFTASTVSFRLNMDFKQDNSVFTAIGSDGFFSTQGQNKYLYCGSDGIIARWGNQSFKLSDNGFQKLNRNGQYVKLLTKNVLVTSSNSVFGDDYRDVDVFVLTNGSDTTTFQLPNTSFIDVGHTITLKKRSNYTGLTVSGNGSYIVTDNNFGTQSRLEINGRISQFIWDGSYWLWLNGTND